MRVIRSRKRPILAFGSVALGVFLAGCGDAGADSNAPMNPEATVPVTPPATQVAATEPAAEVAPAAPALPAEVAPTMLPSPEAPAAETPAAETPAPSEPVNPGQGGEEPALADPVEEEPVVEEPVVEEPVVEEPVVEEPVVEEPVVEEPVVEEPVVEEPVVEEPADAKEMLKALWDNAKFQSYVDNEIGNPVVMMTGTGNDEDMGTTIVVPPGAVFDGSNKTYKPPSDGSQDESQPPVFLLAPGASLINTVIGKPGGEGVHMMGDNVLDNVHWPDVGEDAASVRSYFPGGRIEIKNGSARNAADKIFQFNAICDVYFTNFEASKMGKFMRQNGGATFPLSITVEDVKISGNKFGAFTGSSNCKVKHRNLSCSNCFDGCKGSKF